MTTEPTVASLVAELRAKLDAELRHLRLKALILEEAVARRGTAKEAMQALATALEPPSA